MGEAQNILKIERCAGRIMKKIHWGKKIIYGLSWMFILFAGIRIVAAGFSEIGGKWWERISYSVTGAVFEMAAPASAYIAGDREETFPELVMRCVRQAAPVWEYAGRKNAGDKSVQDPFYEEAPYARAELSVEGDTEKETETGEEVGENLLITVEEAGVEPVTEAIDSIVLSEEIFTPEVIGTEYPLAKLCDYDFLIQHFYAVSEITTITSEELNAGRLLEKNLSLEKQNTEPQILIYHTHSQEEFCDSRPGVQEDTIVGVGSYLTELLTGQYGYVVYHDMTPYDMAEGQLDRNNAYNYAAEGVEAILEKYPSIEVIIDLHRDGVNEGVHLVTEINGKPTAQIMFVNGISKTSLQGNIGYLYNPYIEDNLAFSLKLQLKAEAFYPDFTRRIMIKAYRYNMHYRGRSLLIETGAQTNTLQEARNAMEPLAVMLHEVLEGG